MSIGCVQNMSLYLKWIEKWHFNSWQDINSMLPDTRYSIPIHYLCESMFSLPNIRELSEEDLKKWFIDNNELGFRSKQVSEWLWQKSVRDFDAMSNLSKPLREKLM